MAISGLVVTLSDNAAALAALSMLSNDPRITLGERFDRRVAVVADTPSVESDRALWDELRGHPGVTNVDVTFVHLDSDIQGRSPSNMKSVEDQHAHH